jgi:novobiocin biosynthesis protein NovU/D-mycarose 3-C-methyltransferase
MMPFADIVEYEVCTSCRACGFTELELLVDFGRMPLAGGFMKPDEIPIRNVTYPLRLGRCSNCTLIQVLESVPPDIIFKQYSYSTSATRTMLEHYTRMGSEIVGEFSAKGKLVVEFGCNDGALIRSLLQAGARAIGVDPSDVARRTSQQDGWKLLNDYFTEETACRIRQEYGRAKIVVGNNVFAHVNDLHSILRGIVELLEDNGVYIFEVYYQGDLLDKTQFDTVYHEHICYYSLTSLTHLFSRHALTIIDVKKTATHSGSIRVVAAKNSSTYVQSSRVAEILEAEKEFSPANFVRRALRYRKEFRDFVQRLKNEGKSVGAYGAAGRMTVLMNYCGLGPDLIDYVVDMSPLRYGRIVPGVLLPIVPPVVFHARPLDYMIMTAWSYEAEILERERSYLEAGGRFIIPLPDVRVVCA